MLAQSLQTHPLRLALIFAVLTAASSLSVRMAARRRTPKQRAIKRVEQSPSQAMAPWVLPLKRAMNHGGTQRAKRDRREAKRKQLQLATVDPSSGRPSVRTVVFRGFLPAKHIGGGNGESCVLTFITDSRANKVRHLATGPGLVELCWWLDEAGVQYRISGRAVLASATSTDPELRTICEAIWERLGSGTRSTPRTPPAQHIPSWLT